MFKGDEYFSLDIEQISDILSRIERFNAHTLRPISVAHHLLHCLTLAEELNYTEREKQLVLFHDVAEAYYGDIPSYIKKFLGAEADLFLHNIDITIYKHFEIEWPLKHEHDRVKTIDLTALALEAEYGFAHRFEESDWPKPLVHNLYHIRYITARNQETTARLLTHYLDQYKGNVS